MSWEAPGDTQTSVTGSVITVDRLVGRRVELGETYCMHLLLLTSLKNFLHLFEKLHLNIIRRNIISCWNSVWGNFEKEFLRLGLAKIPPTFLSPFVTSVFFTEHVFKHQNQTGNQSLTLTIQIHQVLLITNKLIMARWEMTSGFWYFLINQIQAVKRKRWTKIVKIVYRVKISNNDLLQLFSGWPPSVVWVRRLASHWVRLVTFLCMECT